ncbi:uncharacterized protein METZ01_LOCUS100468 [marine metagenome]|uniref:Uncharacterized protein n=1 Tax=marine metagenome TaxID=408172 RepID=A0A381W534_9ZZZZ
MTFLTELHMHFPLAIGGLVLTEQSDQDPPRILNVPFW